MELHHRAPFSRAVVDDMGRWGIGKLDQVEYGAGLIDSGVASLLYSTSCNGYWTKLSTVFLESHRPIFHALVICAKCEAQPPPTLTVSSRQGALQAGQSATIQVSAVNKKSPSGTITVIASHDDVSTQDKVSCR
jgi:hypothetical protein